MTCSTCDDYKLVPDDTGRLVDCPDCHARRGFQCPAHGDSVLVSPSGKLLGRCWGCVNEAQRAERALREEMAA